MKNILITGVSKGLGLKISEILLLNNFRVYGISRTLSDPLKELMKNFGDNIKIKFFDVSDIQNIKKEIFLKFIPNEIPIWGYVNNAAIAYDDLITNANYNMLKHSFDINFFSAVIFSKYVIRNMLYNHTKGSIVHISSISVHTGYKGLSMYAASKGALEALSKNIAREWGERGIRSNCVVAGFMETDMSSKLSNDQKNRIYQRNALKKPTSIESVAETVLFLLSEKSESITGQNLFVDSGTI